MRQGIIYVGLDVHKKTVAMALARPEEEAK